MPRFSIWRDERRCVCGEPQGSHVEGSHIKEGRPNGRPSFYSTSIPYLFALLGRSDHSALLVVALLGHQEYLSHRRIRPFVAEVNGHF